MRALAQGGTRIDTLHPTAPASEDLNDGSLVLHLQYGAASLLFTGDLERPGELELLEARTDATESVRSVVLKVAHHGSGTSSSAPLLAAVAPRLAVISAGADNRFGFPAAAVLARLRDAGAEIWRTDEDGAVRLDSDGVRLVVHGSNTKRPPRVLALDDSVTERRFEMPTSLW
jgi:competence protein ComEC